MKSLHSVFVALVVIATASSPASGAVFSTGEVLNGESATFTPPASLIQGLTATSTGGNPPIATPTAADWTKVNDGIVGPANYIGQTLLFDIPAADFSAPYIVFTLDTSVNTLGYDITSIESFAGFNANRPWQNIQIKYALVGETILGELTHTLGSYAYQPLGLTGYNATKLTIADNFGDVILTGVSAIQIVYLDNGFNGVAPPAPAGANYTSYKELSVVGYATAPIPEPSSVLLLGVAAAGVLLRFRRK